MEETMTVEQIKAAANEQIGILYKKLQEANMENAFKRLDYLFMIVEGSFNDEMKDKAKVEIDKMVFGVKAEGDTTDAVTPEKNK